MSFLTFVLASALSGASPSSADQLIARRCPNAVSEEVEACAYKLVGESDRRITANLCGHRKRDCAAAATFKRNRDGLVQSYLAAAGESVVARVDAAMLALEVTRSFERRLPARG
jgi:homoserine acetyltransferase